MNTAASLPARIGRFQVRTRLGAGVFADVYRAHDPQLAREVAVKVVRDGVLADATAVQRFLREGKVAARLCHPHIVSVFDAGQDGGRYYLAASFIDGQSLAQRLQDGPLDARAAAVLVRDLAEALQHAHQTGVIHRDVKPANILLDAHGSAHLADFGVAHVGEALEKLTQDGTVLGSPAYMAPELAAGRAGQPLPASDQYSLGVVLYEVLSGRAPFRGAPAKVLHDAVHTRPTALRQLKPDVPLDLETICLKTLAKRPEDRYSSCQALADDLRRWLEGEPITARRMGVVERLRRWCKREPKLAWTSLSAACGLLGAALLSLLATAVLGSVLAQEQHERTHLDTIAANAKQNAADAEKQRQLAEDATTNASAATTDAEKQTDLARKAREKMSDATLQANAALAALERRQREQRPYRYVAGINVAFQAFLDKDLSKAADILKDYEPKGDEEDVRGFEWYYLVDKVRRRSFQLKRDESSLGIPASMSCMAVVPTGPRLAVAEGKTIRLLTLEDGARPLALPEQSAAVTCLAAAGETLAVGTEDGSVRLWNSAIRQEEKTLCERGLPIRTLAISGDGKTLAAGRGSDGLVTLWNCTTGMELPSPPSLHQPVHFLALTPDGKLLVYAATNRNVFLWDVLGKADPVSLSHKATVTAVALAPDGKTLVTADEDQTLHLWNVTTRKEQATLAGRLGKVSSLLFAPDGRTILAAGQQGEIKLWEAVTGYELASFSAKGPSPLVLAIAPHGDVLVSASRGGTFNFWEADARGNSFPSSKPPAPFSVLDTFNHPQSIASLAFSPNGNTLAIGSFFERVRLFEVATGKTSWLPAPARGNYVAFAPDGKTLACASGNTISLLEVATGNERAKLTGHSQPILCLAFSPDGMTLASGSMDTKIKLWDPTTSKCRTTLTADTKSVYFLAFAPDGKTFASAGHGGDAVKWWDVATGKKLAGDAEMKYKVAFAPDGKTFATIDLGFGIVLWDAATGKKRAPLKGHSKAVYCWAFSPDGKTLASGSADTSIILWDVATGEQLASLRHSSVVTHLAFSPDGKTLASVSDNKTVKLWDVSAATQR